MNTPPSSLPPLRVCYFGAYREEYPRNQIMIHGLRQAGAEVIECHQPLWHGIQDRVQVASGGWLKPRFWLRLLHAYTALLGKYRRVGRYDVLVVGYPGHYDVFLARLLAWLRGRPLAWDVL
ncbi:MAG: group 1 glycosyl transferase, partial [Chloroflexi bacterium]|nr:group 1 glycosyl transferase [Chloroflexota bacterium]